MESLFRIETFHKDTLIKDSNGYAFDFKIDYESFRCSSIEALNKTMAFVALEWFHEVIDDNLLFGYANFITSTLEMISFAEFSLPIIVSQAILLETSEYNHLKGYIIGHVTDFRHDDFEN